MIVGTVLGLVMLAAPAGVGWVDLSSVDASIPLDAKRFPVRRGFRHVADSCWLREPAAVALYRAFGRLKLQNRKLSVERCYEPLKSSCREPSGCPHRKEFSTGGAVRLNVLDGYNQPLDPQGPGEEERLNAALQAEGFRALGKGCYLWKTAFPTTNVSPADLTTSDKAAGRLIPIPD